MHSDKVSSESDSGLHDASRDVEIDCSTLRAQCRTGDTRNARAISVIEALQQKHADVVADNPVATENMKAHFPDLEYATSAANALENAHGAVVVTDWDEFAAVADAVARGPFLLTVLPFAWSAVSASNTASQEQCRFRYWVSRNSFSSRN